MNIEKKSLEKARKLLAELKTLEEVDVVLGNYDASAYAVFQTYHNNNTKTLKEVSVPMPSAVRMLYSPRKTAGKIFLHILPAVFSILYYC